MANQLIRLNKASMMNLPRPQEGDMIHVIDEDRIYIYKNSEWNPITIQSADDQGIKMELYELNCSIVSQLPNLTEFEDKIALINEYRLATNQQFYMLYGKAISYFTLFMATGCPCEVSTLGDGVIECLQNIGDIRAIDYTENKDAIEIWVHIADNDVTTCLYLFPYDNGVVTMGV